MWNTPIQKIDNNLYVKRDDLIPYSFGGNKARKAFLFFEEIYAGGYDCVVTYGSSHSNHCRIISNMSAARGLPCYLISPKESSEITYNSIFMKMFGARIITVPVDNVHDTIEMQMERLRRRGMNPYFIPGGGHGNIGTKAYIECYDEIKEYEEKNKIFFDYIFFASGTGTTQAGLVCGQILCQDNRKIIGISIARRNPYGRDIVVNSVRKYLPNVSEREIIEKIIFIDDYVIDGYGKENLEIMDEIQKVMLNYGIPMDSTYTVKAYLGMKKYLAANKIENKNTLFIHTGGTPLFFDDVKKICDGDFI